jgi:dTDP-4-amino-4,6-dideoxygalactose transaminase
MEEYNTQLKKAWNLQWITNRGRLVLELEEKLKDYLEVENVIITNNGTVPLQIALKLLAKKGEVITTPFSYVATAASIVWENCSPVFVDIDPEHLTIDENKIEAAITKKTTTILATHVFGNPCNIEAIDVISKKYNLKVIYDAAHCFGVKYKNQSIFKYGDVSTCSFHATKLFHCGEGGAMFANDGNLSKQMFYSHNFGHNGLLDFHGLGINGKISELQAALGLAIFPYMEHIIDERKKIVNYYNSNLLNVTKLNLRGDTEWNYSYYPVIFDSEGKLLQIEKALTELDIFPRRYFYPSLNTINYLKGQNMPVSESISRRILCLPLYLGLRTEELELIVSTINLKVTNSATAD